MDLTSMPADGETKFAGGTILEAKKATRNGEPVGVIEAHIAAWSLDEGLDKFEPGAFLASIEEHRSRRDRQVRLKDHHMGTIGGFPIDTVKEDSIGLLGRGEINLTGERGQVAYSMARQGVLVDMSIGFTPQEFRFEGESGDVRVITKALVWEGSIVDEPMNRDAQIAAVKSGSAVWRLPLAGATERWTGTEDGLEVARGGKVYPQRLNAVALSIITGKAEASRDEIVTLERCFANLSQSSPFPPELRGFIGVDEARGLTPRDVEGLLTRGMVFSKGAARIVVGCVTKGSAPELKADPASDPRADLRAFASRIGA